MSVFRSCADGFFTLGAAVWLVVMAVAPLAGARDWLVPEQAPTIQAAVDSCVSGDVVVIAPGTYDDCTHANGNNVMHIAILTDGVNLRGSTGDPADVILDAGGLGRCLEIRNAAGDIGIEGLTLRGGQASNPFGSGGGVFVFRSYPDFRQCVFDSNNAEYAGGAIAVSHGSLDVEDCVFLANGTDNIGGAIRATSSPTVVTGSTFHITHGAAVHYANDTLTLSNCLITEGDAAAVVRNLTSDEEPTLSCCDLWGNEEDYSDFFSDQNGVDGNISVDPLYCNPFFDNLHLYATSFCSPDNNPECGQIGALEVACGYGTVTHVVAPDGSGDFPTIQDAMNMAADGDTIALADGVFTGDGNRDLDYLGKNLVVRGQSGDPELAVIDCQGSAADPHRGFHFQRNEGRFAELRHVTIMNGDVAGDGGAILCEGDPLIENCILRNNHAERGAGLFCNNGSPRIEACRIYENEGRGYGGGIGFHASEATVTDCLIYANWGFRGGALSLPDSSDIVVTGCTLVANASSSDKACVEVEGVSYLDLQATLIAFNNRYGVRCFDQGHVSVDGSNIFGNASGDYTDCLDGEQDRNGNVHADPRFCDADLRDYHLRGDSPCTDYNAPDLALIGALGVGCDAPSIYVDASAGVPAVQGRSGGAVWTDLDRDGNLDVFVANRNLANEVLLGDGAGGFSDSGDPVLTYGGTSLTAAWGDWDNDGDLDGYLGNDGQINLLVRNDDGVFAYVINSLVSDIGPAGGSSFVDFNADGYLDLFMAAPDSGSLLLRGDGDGEFVEATSLPADEVGLCTASVWGDYDNDGDQDLYLVQDGQENKLFEYTGGFSDETGSVIDDAGAGRSAAWGDHDNDGDLDLYLVNEDGANYLWDNDGDGTFTDITAGPLGDTGPGQVGAWGDWDNDGDLDLFLANAGSVNRLLRNEGDGLFIDARDPLFAAADSTTGAAFGDHDNDGDLDLLLADRTGPTRVFANADTSGNHWLKIELVRFNGQVGAPGARVRIVTADSLAQIREVSGGTGLSANAPLIHFGLGAATEIDSLIVVWPSDIRSELLAVSADQVLVVTEPNSSPVVDDPGDGRLPRACVLATGFPNPFNPVTTFRYELPDRREVRIRIYDVAGRLVQILFDGPQSAGRHEVVWRGRDRRDRAVAAGVYFCRMEAGDYQQTRAVTLLK